MYKSSYLPLIIIEKSPCNQAEILWIILSLYAKKVVMESIILPSIIPTKGMKMAFWNFILLSICINNRVTIATPKKIYFTAFYADPKNIYKGLIILGPHTCYKNHPMDIAYKPRCLMSNLISLFYIIDKDINQGRFFKQGYSFHVKRAIDYIDSRYSDDITLEDIVDHLKINKSYFCTLFKKETGKTFTEFLNQTRVEKSKSLLLEDISSILDIALAVGFSNQNYFSILFRRYTGITPMQYRKNGGLEKAKSYCI